MIKANKKLAVPMLSLLSVAMLSACGGSGSDAGWIGNKSDNWFGERPEGVLPNGMLIPTNQTAGTAVKFLVDMKDQGQQTKNIVTLLNHNNQNTYFTVDFDQPGVISEICVDCQNQEGLASAIEGVYTNEINKLTEKRDKLKEALDKAKNSGSGTGSGSGTTSIGNAFAVEIDGSTQTAASVEQQIDDLNKRIERLQSEMASKAPQSGVVYMRDINGVLHTVYQTGSVDGVHNPYDEFIKQTEFMKHDAGINKIDGEWVLENGQYVAKMRGGVIDRRFNGLVIFNPALTSIHPEGDTTVPQNSSLLDIYLRDPSASGLSFTTFGAFKNPGLQALRDAEYGYQSIGVNATDIPKAGKADYSGISHAYYRHIRGGKYEDDQLTMHVNISANFAKRKLGMNTLDTTLHTYEKVLGKERHMITKRPDLNLQAEAQWGEGLADFKGNIRSASGRLNGNIEGSFYGPAAAEVGGVYGLQNKDNTEQVVGGFGAKRP